jgi:hypothetical protein
VHRLLPRHKEQHARHFVLLQCNSLHHGSLLNLSTLNPVDRSLIL